MLLDVVQLDRLDADFVDLQAQFAANGPFRHAIVENFLSPGHALAVVDAFPRLDPMQLAAARVLEARSYDGEVRRFGPEFDSVFSALGSESFTIWLRKLTGIPDLEIDVDNVGGGVHQGARGSRLAPHADHNTHPNDPTRYRRINVLVYLNANWDPSWGGNLEMYDATGSRVVKEVEPIFNRCIIMEVHDQAFHGYRPLRVPKDNTRKTLAAYFYSRSPSPLQTIGAHPTLEPVKRTTFGEFVRRVRFAILNRLPWISGLRPKPLDDEGHQH